MMNRFVAGLAIACALLVSACVPKDGTGPSGTSAEGYRQIAIGVGQVIGRTKADEKITELTAYCTELQLVANVGGAFVPEKHRRAAEMAQAAINAICSRPPRDVSTALVSVVDAVEAVRAVQTQP